MPSNSDSTPRPFSWWWLGIALPSSAIVGFVVAAILWGGTRAEHRDAFDTGWKSAAAVLAALAAVVTVERLRLGQREHYRQLAADQAKEINELSTKASEQLGSDKAAVRIGGLTDLERLAQAHPDLRQTVVDRICAYLREPYTPPPVRIAPEDRRYFEDLDDDDSESEPTTVESESDKEALAARRLELDVRRTAQGILKRHLSPHDDTRFWRNILLDLRDASLVEFNLDKCEIAGTDFEGATFYRACQFTDVAFKGEANFERAKFEEVAHFDNAIFHELANFTLTKFLDGASFSRASFYSHFHIYLSRFKGYASFNQARFSKNVAFMNSTFQGITDFRESEFTTLPSFEESKFKGRAFFHEATFTKGADFENVEFHGRISFNDIKIGTGHTTLNLKGATAFKTDTKHALPPGWSIKEGKLTHDEQQ